LDSGARDSGELQARLAELFSVPASARSVTLSSIHRSKGLEADLVVHLDPWRVPSKHAVKEAKAGKTTALEQEWNLKYVCETRTRQTLLFADSRASQQPTADSQQPSQPTAKPADSQTAELQFD
jgi:superfamily I DNA/RNA helicase